MLDSFAVLGSLVDQNNAFVITDGVLHDLTYDISDCIIIPEGVVEITAGVFREQSITRVVFPSSLRIIGESAFEECVQLTGISFAPAAHVTTIMDCAFRGCRSLVDIELPESLEYLGYMAFGACAAVADTGRMIRELCIPKHTFVARGCFMNTSIDLLRIKADLIDSYAFANSNVFRVSWESECSSIPEQAFSSCIHLCEFNFVNITKLRTIGVAAFMDCCSLYSIALPEGVTHIMEHAFNKAGLQYFQAPTTLKAIGNRAFMNTKCISIQLANSQLEVVGAFAFANTQITELTIRGKVSILDYSIVAGCKQLVCLRVGPSVKYLIDTRVISSADTSNRRIRFDMAIILEGLHTQCATTLAVPIVFLPKGAETDVSAFYHESKCSHEDGIEGFENGYGRYLISAGTYIYY